MPNSQTAAGKGTALTGPVAVSTPSKLTRQKEPVALFKGGLNKPIAIGACPSKPKPLLMLLPAAKLLKTATVKK